MTSVTADSLIAHRTSVAARYPLVVFPESTDERVLVAAAALTNAGIVRPLLLGASSVIADRAKALGVRLNDNVVRDPETDPERDRLAACLVEGRAGLTVALASRLLRKPLYFGGMLVATGAADGMVAGAANPTRRILEAALMTIGLAEGVPAASSAMLMQVPGRAPLLFADCAVNVDPAPAELAGIAIASAATAQRLLGVTPKVALLSFSTKGSAQHPHIDKVRAALALVRERLPDLAIDGELQAEAALSCAIAARKVKEPSAVAGAANVLVFPDLDAGNISYKLVQQLAGAAAYGPLLQGFRRPLCDLSRGATVEEIVTSTVLTLV